ncbi:hypothetical protein AGMMS50212_10680 [Spirochaetia bacterium]|nr:hypothetical protein AGMMS50212_10680 [Spirochaetia bacterium]
MKKNWLETKEVCVALAGISRSTLNRRMKELNLVQRGYAIRLGRRILFSSNLITDLPALLENKSLVHSVKNDETIGGKYE